MPVVPPAAQSEKAQMDAADAQAQDPTTQDGGPSPGTPAAPSPDRAVLPADAKPPPAENDASKPLSELAKAPAPHPDVHPHADILDDDDDGLEDTVSGQSPVDTKPEAPAPAPNPPAADGAAKPPAAEGGSKPAAPKPPAADGESKPPAADGAEKPPVAGAEPPPKAEAKPPAQQFNDQGTEDPPAPPPPSDPKVTKPPASPEPPSKPAPLAANPDAPPPTTQEVQAALDRIYANANKDADRHQLANGHDTQLQIPYRALGIALLVFVAFFAGVRWKRRPRYGGYSPVPLRSVEVHEREEQPVVKPRQYRD